MKALRISTICALIAIGAVPVQASDDILVNNPAGDAGGVSHTQSGTSIAVNLDSGVVCSGYNDSYSGVVLGEGYTGVSRSINAGLSFQDLGALSNASYGYPSMAWRRADGHFYLATLHASGLGLWVAPPDCSGFGFHTMIHTGSGDDKEFIAIDNNPTSPYFGRVYAVFTDFSAGGFIYSTHSDDTSNWTTPVALNGVASVQGAWPAIAPNGDLYVAWVRWDPYPSGPITIEMVKSVNGGATFSSVTSPMAGKVNPRDITATSNCGRPALHGNIRIIPWPQVAIGPDGVIHVVYSYDPDVYNAGDVIDVFYRRSLDGGASWQPEFRLNDDNTTNDQWFPTLSVGPTNRVVAAWYDRWEDPANTVFRYYSRSSNNGGATWQPSVPVSDVQSPIYLDPNLATCYHGDYDHQVQDELGRVYLQWSDDRNFQGGHDDPDVWFERDPAVEPLFVDGFESGDFSAWSSWQP